MSHFTLRETPPALQWAALLGASLVGVSAFELMRLPAALLLGAIAAAILVSWFEGRVTIPPWAFVIAQGFVGCLVARSITPDIVMTIFRQMADVPHPDRRGDLVRRRASATRSPA